SEGNEREVAQAPESRHGFLGLARDHPHVAQPTLDDLSLDIAAHRTGTGEEERDICALSQHLRRIEHPFERMRHAVRTHVAQHELALEAELPDKGLVARAGRIAIEIHAVDDNMDLVRIDT